MFKQKHPSLDPSTKQLTFLNKFCFLTIHVDYKLEISSIHANTCQINFYFPPFEVDSANNFTLIRLKPRQTSSTEREKEGEREKSSSLTIFRSIPRNWHKWQMRWSSNVKEKHGVADRVADKVKLERQPWHNTRVYVAVRSYELRRRFADFVTTRFTACLPIVSLVCNLARNYPHTMPFYSQNTSNRRVARIVRYFPLLFSLSPFASPLPTKESFFFSFPRKTARFLRNDGFLALPTSFVGKRIYRVWSRVQCVSLLLWFYGGTLSSEEERIIGWWARLLFLG